MLSADLQKKLMDEFDVVEKGRNPKITSDIEAIVVLSGESLDPAIKTDLHDTEERLAEGIRIYQGIQFLTVQILKIFLWRRKQKGEQSIKS